MTKKECTGLNWRLDAAQVEALGGTVGQKLLAEERNRAFDGEDEEDEDDPMAKYSVKQKPGQAVKKSYEDKGAVIDDTPLDDPELEKMRQARLQEEADFQHTLDTFGDTAAAKLDKMIPKSEKDFEEFSALLVGRYITPHKRSAKFKFFLKCLVKLAADGLDSQEVKDVESSLASVRVQKSKQEKAERDLAARKGKKAALNVGKNSNAGLDDLLYEDDGDEEFDFM